MLKRVLAVLGVAFGSLALFYFVFAWSLTLKDFGSSVETQLIAQRILTPLLLFLWSLSSLNLSAKREAGRLPMVNVFRLRQAALFQVLPRLLFV